MRDGPVAVPRQAGPRRKQNGREFLASVGLDRVTADVAEPRRHGFRFFAGAAPSFAALPAGCAAGLRLKLALMLPKMSG